MLLLMIIICVTLKKCLVQGVGNVINYLWVTNYHKRSFWVQSLHSVLSHEQILTPRIKKVLPKFENPQHTDGKICLQPPLTKIYLCTLNSAFTPAVTAWWSDWAAFLKGSLLPLQKVTLHDTLQSQTCFLRGKGDRALGNVMTFSSFAGNH